MSRKSSAPTISKIIVHSDGNTITVDELLVAVGRTPNTDKLGLETVGLKPGNWIQVDDTCLVHGVGRGSMRGGLVSCD